MAKFMNKIDLHLFDEFVVHGTYGFSYFLNGDVLFKQSDSCPIRDKFSKKEKKRKKVRTKQRKRVKTKERKKKETENRE